MRRTQSGGLFCLLSESTALLVSCQRGRFILPGVAALQVGAPTNQLLTQLEQCLLIQPVMLSTNILLVLDRLTQQAMFFRLLHQFLMAYVGVFIVDIRSTGKHFQFIDNTRNHSRRWCSMESCGNRAKAGRHYARQRLAP